MSIQRLVIFSVLLLVVVTAAPLALPTQGNENRQDLPDPATAGRDPKNF
jgi:hypothetical protein